VETLPPGRWWQLYERNHPHQWPLKTILNILFGFGAVSMFAEFLIFLRRAFAFNFTAGRIVQLIVCAFILVMCLAWTAGLNSFQNTIVPLW
jgi:hypothetical protein